MGTVVIKVCVPILWHKGDNASQEVTVAPYDPFSHGEQAYLGSMDIELSFTKPNYRADYEFDADDLARFFIKVPPTAVAQLTSRITKTKSSPQARNSP